MKKLLSITSFLFFLQAMAQSPTAMVEIKGGTYIPMYGVKEKQKETKPVKVKSFLLDVYPVTNAQ